MDKREWFKKAEEIKRVYRTTKSKRKRLELEQAMIDGDKDLLLRLLDG